MICFGSEFATMHFEAIELYSTNMLCFYSALKITNAFMYTMPFNSPCPVTAR